MTSTTPLLSSTADALFPKVRQRVLAVLFGTPDRSFYANELIAMAQSGKGAALRDLAGLCEAGLITVHQQGNPKHSVFVELRGLVLKTMGLGDVLRAALAPIASQIGLAFVFGSMAQQQNNAFVTRVMQQPKIWPIGQEEPPHDTTS